MTAFIVRPFGVKKGVDFDRVERELIAPALEQLELSGRTTQDITAAGNIRADMFQLLLTSDIVIADISVHNANVFYELGIRHALRDKWTVLLRASMDEVPFDLKTDRYLAYDATQPGATLPALIESLASTKRNQTPDSPVFGMIPGLKAPDPSVFIVVPPDFREEVRRADVKNEHGDLRFLASELQQLPWRREGLRLIGDAQFRLDDGRCAIDSWESVRAEFPYDLQANLRLGTLYQRSGDLDLSDEALGRVVNFPGLSSDTLAEARALLGSNAKVRWFADWANAEESSRQAEALQSSFLASAFNEYRYGFEADTSHYYSGLNALALATVITELAAAQPDIWQERFNDEGEARAELNLYQTLRNQLNGAVEFALRARKQKLEREGRADDWLSISTADHAFLSGKPNAGNLYRESAKRLGEFARDSALRQLRMFQMLGILTRSVSAVTLSLPAQHPVKRPGALPRVILFSGHRIDEAGRPTARFPASQEKVAHAAIRRALENELEGDDSPAIVISGGASGGDLLFLECCEDLNLKRNMYLVIPREEYVKSSVAPAGPAWIQRFNHQYDTVELSREYQRSREMPVWLQNQKGYTVWHRSNTWMLYNALSIGGAKTTLIALWDRAAGNSAGGAGHMVQVAERRGVRTIILDSNQLFGISSVGENVR